MAVTATFFIIISLSSLFITVTSAQSVGFGTVLYHRDSPFSPLYDPTISQTERVRRAVDRSISRANHFRLRLHSSSISPNSPKAYLKGDGAEYLMNISIGTPPFPIIAIADTGSDLIWTQCAPCKGCFKQDFPLFTPKKSSTFRKIPCESSACPSSVETSCTKDNSCGYETHYGDGSYSYGIISTETITMKSTTGGNIKLPKSVFGCGFENQGTFNSDGSGIIGLGGGSESLTSQLNSQINGKFSYCLSPVFNGKGDGVSTMNFGRTAVVSGSGTLKTPLIKSSPDTFYYLNLKGFTVGAKKVRYNEDYSRSAASGTEGNIIIDSGTTLVLLTPNIYSEFESAVKNQIKAKPVEGATNVLNLCYKDDESFKPPSITANFEGADVKLKPYNTFVKVSDELICLAFASSEDLSIYGNLAQMNFLIGYDTAAGTLSFKPTDCSKG